MAKVPDELLEAVDWNKTFQRLVVFAHRAIGFAAPLPDAEDLAGEAIRRFLDPEYADWDRESEPSLERHLGSIVNGMVRNRWRNKTRQHGVAVDFGDPAVAAKVASALPSPEERLTNSSTAKRVLALLEQEIKGDDDAESVLLLEWCDGVDDAQEQAKELGLPIAKVYKARFRLGQAREAVRRRMLEKGLA